MKLIKLTDDHYVIVYENAEIKEGDWYLGLHNKVIKATDGKHYAAEAVRFSGKPVYKITNSTDIDINELYYISLQEVKELIGEVDVEKKSEIIAKSLHDKSKHDDWSIYDQLVHEDKELIKLGYNQALEDNKEKKYTEADLRKAINMARDIKDDSAHDVFTAEDVSGCTEVCTYGWRNRYKDEEIIQSLQPKTEWEVQINFDGKLELIK